MIYSVTNVVLLVIIFEKVLSTVVPHFEQEQAPDSQEIPDPKFKRKVKHEDHHDDHYEYPRYKYGYSVHDPKTKDIKSAWEHRDGDITHGEYSLVEPDGAIRIVKYVVDKHHGFRAVVDRIPPSNKGEKSSQSFEKFQSYHDSPLPERHFDMSIKYQTPKINDFHHSNQNQEFQSLRTDIGQNRDFQFFYPQQDEDENDSEEEEDDVKDDENLKENLRYISSGQPKDSPRHSNYQSQSLQDVSSRFRNPTFEFNQMPARPHQSFNQNPNDGMNFRFNPAQFNVRSSARDFSDKFQDLGDGTGFEAAKMNTLGKTASYQSMSYNTPKLSEPISYEPHQNENPLGPMSSLEPHNINMDTVKHLPYYEDTYYPPQNGNYKFSSQPEVEAPVGKVLNALNVPPAHSFPSTSHLLIPPKEKLPNYQNSHLNLPPAGTPISHNHHHTGQFERYD